MVVSTAVIGAGVVSDTHLSAAAANPRADLVAVCDLDEDRARSTAAEYGIEAYFDVDDLLAAEALDLVHVCTPVQTHLPIARKAIEAGVAVVIEKPVADSVAEVEELQSLSETHDVPVTVIHQHLYDPAVRTARRMIDSGELGEVRAVELVKTGLTKADEANRGTWVSDLPGGEFEEGLPHHIYLPLATGGYPRNRDDVRAVTSLVGDYGDDYSYDNAQVQYATSSGTLCSMTMTSGGHAERLLHVQGERRSITVDLLTQVVAKSRGSYRGSPLKKAKKNADGAVDRLAGTAKNVALVLQDQIGGDWETRKRLDPHAYQIAEVVDAVETGSPMPVSLEEARWTIAIMETIREESGEPHQHSTAVTN